MSWTLLYTKQAQKDAKKISSSGLRPNVERLLHMLEGIKRLKEMLVGISKEEFLENHKLQDASSFNISTIGEAAAHVSEDFQSAHPEIPWHKLRGIRNHLVHVFDYEQIDYDIVTILPCLKYRTL